MISRQDFFDLFIRKKICAINKFSNSGVFIYYYNNSNHSYHGVFRKCNGESHETGLDVYDVYDAFIHDGYTYFIVDYNWVNEVSYHE